MYQCVVQMIRLLMKWNWTVHKQGLTSSVANFSGGIRPPYKNNMQSKGEVNFWEIEEKNDNLSLTLRSFLLYKGAHVMASSRLLAQFTGGDTHTEVTGHWNQYFCSIKQSECWSSKALLFNSTRNTYYFHSLIDG